MSPVFVYCNFAQLKKKSRLSRGRIKKGERNYTATKRLNVLKIVVNFKKDGNYSAEIRNKGDSDRREYVFLILHVDLTSGIMKQY